MEEQGIFKTSVFGGFDKQSVLSYVDEMIKKGQEKEKELTARCEDAERERDLYLQKYTEESKKNAELSEKARLLEEAEKALEKKEQELCALRGQEQAGRAKNAELAALLADYEEKGRKYDEVASQVGIVMVEAQNQAEAIVSRAHAQAEQVAQEAISNIYTLNKRLDQALEDVYRLRSYAGQTIHAFDEQMAQLDVFIKESVGRLYIGAGNTAAEGGAHYAQQPYAQEPAYAPQQGPEPYYAPQPEEAQQKETGFAEPAPAESLEETGFFPQPAGA